MRSEPVIVDPRHHRPLPSGRALARVMRAVLRQMRAEFLRNPRIYQPSYLSVTLFDLLLPIFERYAWIGAKQTQPALCYKSTWRWRKAIGGALLAQFNVLSPQILATARRMTFAFLDGFFTSTADMLRAALAASLAAGETALELQRRLVAIFGRERAAVIGQTEASRATHEGQRIADKDSGVIEKRAWLASADACPMCLLPGNLVLCPQPLAASRVGYDGPVLGINFLRGGYVTVTPNDEFLTPSGLKSASCLVQGERVVYCGLRQREPAQYPNDYKRPSLIEDVFRAFSESTSSTTRSMMRVSGEHFHGDGAFGNGEIEIIRSHRFLRDKRDPGRTEHLAEEFFERPLMRAVLFPDDGTTAFFVEGGRNASESIVSSLRHGFPQFGGPSLAVEELCFSQSPLAYPCLAENSLDDDFTDSMSASKISDCFAVGIGHRKRRGIKFDSAFWSMADDESTCDRVVNVARFHYRGPVYDVQTQSGLYIVGNGVVKSNCLELDGKEVGMDEPFYIRPEGGPYAVILGPPAHPRCACTTVGVF